MMKTTIKSLALALVAGCGVALTSCEDMLTKESDYYIYADQDHLGSAADTVNSVLGIVNKLQNIAVRTNLLGEVRADLVKLNAKADINLRELADNAISDDNKYNAPGDYFAVINNCNYFLAKANPNLANVAKDTIFRKEIDAVRVYRAWTYLQLAMNYGSVPLVTEPVLTEAEAEEWEAKPRTDLLGICNYFINDLSVNYKSDEFPQYGRIDDKINPLLIFMPRLVVLGDLYLWRNALTGDVTDAKNAALCYYRWIANTNVPGRKSFLTTDYNYYMWADRCFESGEYESSSGSYSYGSASSYGGENIFFVPMDSASNQANYNQLRVLYNSRQDNDYEAAISPSKVLTQISSEQVYCGYIENQHQVVYVTADMISDFWTNKERLVGDLRQFAFVTQRTGRIGFRDDNGSVTYREVDNYQTIEKMDCDNICLYRTGQLYLRLAEALNAAGYPAFASTILTWGLSDYSIENGVLPYCTTAADSAYVRTFSFPSSEYFVYDQPGATSSNINQMGIHSRGSGNTYRNERYYVSAYADAPVFVAPELTPADSALVDELAAMPDYEDYDVETLYAAYLLQKTTEAYEKYEAEELKPFYNDAVATEQNKVDSLLQVEWALEECFEGTRFYSLMRADYRYRNQGLGWTDHPLSKAIGRRDPAQSAKLEDENSWYMNWQGKIGK